MKDATVSPACTLLVIKITYFLRFSSGPNLLFVIVTRSQLLPATDSQIFSRLKNS